MKLTDDGRELITYSMLQAFKNCRMLKKHRYDDGLVPNEYDPVLWLGTLYHRAHDCYAKTGDYQAALNKIQYHEEGDPEAKDQFAMEKETETRLRAKALFMGWMSRWGNNAEYEFLLDANGNKSVEYQFQVDIINPETNAKSRSFVLGGQVDGILRRVSDGTIWLLERKSASSIGSGYLEKLWTDFQIRLYKKAIERMTGIKIEGVLYDVAEKTGIKKKKEETEEEFRIRHAELCAKNKSGTSSAKRSLGETWAEFEARLIEAQNENLVERYIREPILLSDTNIESMEMELWELTQQLLDARRRPDKAHYQNGAFCFHWNKPCPYWKLCRSEMSPIVRENFYHKEEVHAELDLANTE